MTDDEKKNLILPTPSIQMCSQTKIKFINMQFIHDSL